MSARSRQRMDEHVRYHFGPEPRHDDSLEAARGIIIACAVTVAVWFAFVAVWLL